MTQVDVAQARPDEAPEVADHRQPNRHRRTVLSVVVAAVAVVVAMYPSLKAGFWSWDWYWIDEHAKGNTAWGGPFYNITDHANPLPVEVQWYRLCLELFGLNPIAHHVLTLAGLLATLGLLYLLARRFGVPHWATVSVLLAGMAPASLTSWTWFAASPHMWAALLGLGAALAHIAWRERGSRHLPLLLLAPCLTVLGLAMKNDAVIGPLLILAWEWLGGRAIRRPGRVLVSVAAVLPMAVFVWWQATAIDPHRDGAQTGIGQVIAKTFGLLRFTFLWQSESELRAEFPPAAAPPLVLAIAGGLVGAAVLVLAAVSLRTRPGRILVASGLASLGPVAVLEPALLSRYVLPPVLLLTLAAGVGLASVVKVSPQRRRIATVLSFAAVAVWAILAHLSSYGGSVATQEESALLAGLVGAGIAPSDKLAVRLVDSQVEPSTAAFRQWDPALPREKQLRGLRFLLPNEPVPAGLRLATATRLPSGAYTVVID